MYFDDGRVLLPNRWKYFYWRKTDVSCDVYKINVHLYYSDLDNFHNLKLLYVHYQH